MKPAGPGWWLYLLECQGGSYYAGIAIDVEERFFSHLFGRGARYTRAYPPVKVIAAARYPSKGDALKAEYALKRVPRADKPGFFRRPAAA
ncbi:MAG: GIY-YIG nuclease family protein [Pseudomonadota bacterium]|nr:GIY-YIG nuclease family protein [Pseudomonadota bacterium]